MWLCTLPVSPAGRILRDDRVLDSDDCLGDPAKEELAIHSSSGLLVWNPHLYLDSILSFYPKRRPKEHKRMAVLVLYGLAGVVVLVTQGKIPPTGWRMRDRQVLHQPSAFCGNVIKFENLRARSSVG